MRWILNRVLIALYSPFRTVSEVAATHVVHMPSQTTGDEGWDRFTFSIKLEDLRRKIDEKQLLLCIRFSVEGKEWWDSNDGQNYRFAFKKTPPPRRRARMFDLSAQPESPTSPRSPVAAPLPGTRGSSFGRMTGWNFPGMGVPGSSPSKGVLGQPNEVSPPQRRTPLPRRSSDSDRHPPSFTAPPPPDVHEHLKLKTYCAPAPPLSPPKEAVAVLAQHKEAVLKPSTHSVVIGGQYATVPVAPELESRTHERRRSWGGEIVEEANKPTDENSWTKQPESQSKALSPPVTSFAREEDAIIPSIGERLDSAPAFEAQSFRAEPVMANLNCTVNELSIITPPSSALSSPPAHDTESGSTSGSTSTMSPASLVASPELMAADLPDVVVDPAERDNQLEAAAAGSGGINSDSYQDFVSIIGQHENLSMIYS